MSNRPQYLVTLDDFERAYGSREFAIRAFKADDPLLTTTSGAYATHYGAKVWAQMNFEINLLGVLPKEPWGPEDGWRVMSAAPSIKARGVPENGDIPDTSKPTFVQVYTKPKTVVTNFNAAEIEILSAKRGQAVKWEDIREVMGEFHKQGISSMLSGTVHTVAGYNFESIDRIVSSYAERTSCSLDANDADVYNLDRDAAASWADATVLHNSTTLRPVTLNLINELQRKVAYLSGTFKTDDLLWVTGYDTMQRWSELLQPLQRFDEVKASIDGPSGIKTWPGRGAGFIVNSYNGIPIIPNQQLQANLCPNNGLTPIFLLNKKYLKFWTDVPTIYREVGVNMGNELLYGKLAEEGMYKTIGELVCTGFFAHGKIRDISAA